MGLQRESLGRGLLAERGVERRVDRSEQVQTRVGASLFIVPLPMLRPLGPLLHDLRLDAQGDALSPTRHNLGSVSGSGFREVARGALGRRAEDAPSDDMS